MTANRDALKFSLKKKERKKETATPPESSAETPSVRNDVKVIDESHAAEISVNGPKTYY
jgi:glycine cleavage system aminomethyltransferase T